MIKAKAYNYTAQKMKLSTPEIVIERNKKTIIGPYFKHAAGGQEIKQKTIVELSIRDEFLVLRFQCLNDTFVDDNYYFENNTPMWNQEVFEVFIANGKDDPTDYLEIEINPNNAIFIARIKNPDMLGSALSSEFIDPKKSGIVYEVNKDSESWNGYLLLPFSLIQYPGIEKNDQFRINFYRIILQNKQSNKDWKCSLNNSIFACWSSTMVDEPAFHRSEYFGLMTIIQ